MAGADGRRAVIVADLSRPGACRRCDGDNTLRSVRAKDHRDQLRDGWAPDLQSQAEQCRDLQQHGGRRTHRSSGRNSTSNGAIDWPSAGYPCDRRDDPECAWIRECHDQPSEQLAGRRPGSQQR
ncbi:hypothetical protein D9M69_433970 [compost metagenome]